MFISCLLCIAADAILSSGLDTFLSALSEPTDVHDTIPSPILASIIERLVHNPPRNWNDDKKSTLQYAVRLRYNRLNSSLPYAVGAALTLADLYSPQNALVRLIHQVGPKGTQSVDSCRDLLSRVEPGAIGYHQVADALLYMAISDNGDKFDLTSFVAAVRQHRSGQRLDWQDVVSAFDRSELRVTKTQFLSLYNALLPVAREVESFDIQYLWGNTWSNPDAQLSFVVALLSTTPSELDISQIPKLRTAFSMEAFADASDEIKEHAAIAVVHPMVSYEATQALFTIIFSSQEAYNSAQSLGIPEAVINANTDIFVCAASAVVKPWTPLQEQALKQLFYPFFTKALPNHSFVMHCLWMHDKTWLAARFIEHYNNNPKVLTLIFEHAREHSWIEVLIGVRNDFGLDFTALAHSYGLVDIEKWSQDHTDANKVPAMELSRAIISFLRFKIEDELQVQREAGFSGSTVPLKVKTVYALLNVIQGTVTEQEEGAIQRQCIQAYPRLINYGDKFDHIIDANGENGNALSEAADAKMQEQYKDMYSGDADARKMINGLLALRNSTEPADQELFACMIHGLFDEYNCFGEYPLEALASTAVLFGGIINFGVLHSRITLSVALFMVVDAVAGYAPEDSMYKFGLQASLHFAERLEEWPQLCERLCRIPGLRGTEVYEKAEEIVRKRSGLQPEESGKDAVLANGDGTAIDTDAGPQPFSSINPDPPLRPDLYEEPDEETSDRVTFVLNNVSKRNIEEKFLELQSALEERFHQWFATYLVENLAKSQPNFQSLYLQLLGLFNRNMLWTEVIRETYVSIARIINAESTMTSSTDRTNLKNLAIWLGLLTLARDRPILHRNISFKDLLIEAHQSQRLLIALPFTCKTLSQAAQSQIFKPPNPWTMELVGILMELYHFAELKLNLKFEIEVVCKELGLDHKTLEPADIIRSIPLAAEESFLQPYAPESMDGFGDMLGLSKRSNERLSAQEVMKSLPDLSTLLTFPPAPGNVSQQQIKHVFLSATQRAIQEIIAPVVDRSVTIAAISTSQLVEKDFSMEPDTEKLQQASYNVVKALSGSLALVTCKEPLRMSIMNNIRLLAAQHLPDQLPEGSILMFLNDNLDSVCKLVEDSAESHSLAEIDAHLERAVEARQVHRQQRPREPFNDPPVSRWAFFVPEPYRQEQGGLNQHQLAIYEDFGRHMRMPTSSHTNNTSQDSSRQIQDVLAEGYLPNMPTPAEAPVLPRQTQQQHRMQPQSLQTQQGHGQVNGFMDMQNIAERVQSLIDELHHTAREAPEEHIRELSANSPTREIYEQLVHLIDSSMQKDNLALMAGQRATLLVFTEAKTRLEIEVLIQFLNQLCALSAPTARQLILYLTSLDDDRIFNAVVVICLLKSVLIDLHHVDQLVAKAMNQRRPIVLDFFANLLDELLQAEQPSPLRADLVLSFAALGQWQLAEADNAKVQDILAKLDQPGPYLDGLPPAESGFEKQDHLEYLIDEWISLQRSEAPEMFVASFLQQLRDKRVLAGREDYAMLIRIACDLSVDGYEREVAISGNFDHAYINVDATAKLIACLVAFEQEDDSGLGSRRVAILEELLCYVVLTFNHHYTTRMDRFNSKVFFRLFSALFSEISSQARRLRGVSEEISVQLGQALLTIQPQLFPGFSFHWITLIGHRLLVVPLMHGAFGRLADEPQQGAVQSRGWDIYTKLVCAALSYLGDLKDIIDTSVAAQDMYRATLRVLCTIQHDYPEFLADNHLFLNSAIADNMVQLFNVVNCANPPTVQDLPDPFTPGLKINRLDQVRQSPTVRADIDGILEKGGIKGPLDYVINNQAKDIASSDLTEIIDALTSPRSVSELLSGHEAQQSILANALMIQIGNTATVASSTFSSAAPQAKFLERLLADASPELRYVLIAAMINQIRYPSTHTHYFSTAVLHLFGAATEDVQQQLARVLVERLLVARPHPWGLIVTILELVKNQRYNIFEQRWMKNAPEIERMLMSIAQTQGYGGSPGR